MVGAGACFAGARGIRAAALAPLVVAPLSQHLNSAILFPRSWDYCACQGFFVLDGCPRLFNPLPSCGQQSSLVVGCVDGLSR